MAESYDPSAGGKVDVKVVPKPEAAKVIIRAALQGAAAFLFSSLSPEERETVVMAMTVRGREGGGGGEGRAAVMAMTVQARRAAEEERGGGGDPGILLLLPRAHSCAPLRPLSSLAGARRRARRRRHQAGRPGRRVVHRRVGRLRHPRRRHQGREPRPRGRVRRARSALQLPARRDGRRDGALARLGARPRDLPLHDCVRDLPPPLLPSALLLGVR